MTDEQLLDVAACNLATSHPSNFGFSEHFVTDRASTIPDKLLARLEAADEGLISMGYVDLLEAIVRSNPQALSTKQRQVALAQCKHHYQAAESVCEIFE